MASDFHHVAVFVSDMDRALHLLQDFLGFTLQWRASKVDLSQLTVMLGVPAKEAELAYLQCHPDGAAIELICPTRPPIGETVAPYGARGSGHLSLMVESLDDLCRRLNDAGWPPLTPVISVTTAGGDAARLCFFRTEDGLTIELIDRDTFSAKDVKNAAE